MGVAAGHRVVAMVPQGRVRWPVGWAVEGSCCPLGCAPRQAKTMGVCQRREGRAVVRDPTQGRSLAAGR